jgi:hypothetical protein
VKYFTAVFADKSGGKSRKIPAKLPGIGQDSKQEIPESKDIVLPDGILRSFGI